MDNKIEYFKFTQSATIDARISGQIKKAGFTGNIKVYDLGLDSEDSKSLVIEGTYENEQCCVAVGYGMNRHNLAIRKKWYRQAPK